jgi:hypothetical protein
MDNGVSNRQRREAFPEKTNSLLFFEKERRSRESAFSLGEGLAINYVTIHIHCMKKGWWQISLKFNNKQLNKIYEKTISFYLGAFPKIVTPQCWSMPCWRVLTSVRQNVCGRVLTSLRQNGK